MPPRKLPHELPALPKPKEWQKGLATNVETGRQAIEVPGSVFGKKPARPGVLIEKYSGRGGLREAALKHGMTRPEFVQRVAEDFKSDKDIWHIAGKWGITPMQASRAYKEEIYRLRATEYKTLKEIGGLFGLTRARVHQLLQGFPKVDVRLISLSKLIKRSNAKIKNPMELLDFMEKNYHLPERRIAVILGISKPEVKNLRVISGHVGKAMEKRYADRKERIIRWAKRLKERSPEKLGFGYLFDHHRQLLVQILMLYGVPPKEWQVHTAERFDRFLKDVGVSRMDAKMKRRQLGKKEVRRRVLKRAKTPLRYERSGYLLLGELHGLGSRPVVDRAIKKLLAQGKLKRFKISRRVYYIRPENEEKMQRLIERVRERKKAGKMKYVRSTVRGIKKPAESKGEADGAKKQAEMKAEKKAKLPERESLPQIERLERLRERREEIGRLLVNGRGKLSVKQMKELQKEKNGLMNQIEGITRGLREKGIPESEWRT